MIYWCLLLSIASIARADPSNTIVRYVSVNNSGILYSYGYPNQLVTTNGINPPSMDWNITSINERNLLFLFDRLDLSDNDTLLICSQKAYSDCAKGNSSYSDCDCAKIQTLAAVHEYIPGPPVLMFRPAIPTNNSVLSRNGYRVTVREFDPMNRRFFQCNTTIDIRDTFTPTFLISEGFLSMTTQFSLCQVKLTSSSGIRIRIPLYSLRPNDSISISGQSTNGSQITWKPANPYNTDITETSYFIQTATVSIHMTQGELRSPNLFIIVAEKYDVTPSICDTYDREFVDTGFPLQTRGVQNHENYMTNLNCTYMVTGIAPNCQLLLQINSLDLEDGADYMMANDFNYQGTGQFKNLIYTSAINISQTAVTIISDGLETRSGVDAYMHLLDCSCPGGNFTLTDYGPLTSFYPMTRPGTTNTYCKGVSCVWIYNTNIANRLVVLNVTKFDISYLEYPQVFVDGMENNFISETGNFSYSPTMKVEIRFLSDPYPEAPDAFYTGFAFSIQYEPIKIEEVNLCNSSLYYFGSSVTTIKEIHVTTCKGRLALELLIPFEDLTVQVFDGSFENGTLIPLADTMMIASGRELSIRITSEVDPSQPNQFIVSDSFTTHNGTVCGGASSTVLSTVEGCLSYFTGIVSHLQVDGPPCPVYKGFSVDERELIPTSDTVSLNIYTTAATFMFTFKIPANYSGGRYYTAPFTETIDLSNGTVLLSNVDFLEGVCHDFCGFQQSFSYSGPESKLFQFELLQDIGNATLIINEDIEYTGSDGLINITIPMNSEIDFEQSNKHNERFFARGTAIDVTAANNQNH